MIYQRKSITIFLKRNFLKGLDRLFNNDKCSLTFYIEFQINLLIVPKITNICRTSLICLWKYWSCFNTNIFSFTFFSIDILFMKCNVKCNVWCRNMHNFTYHFSCYISSNISEFFQVFPAYWNRYIELVSSTTQKVIYSNIIYAQQIFLCTFVCFLFPWCITVFKLTSRKQSDLKSEN